MDKITGIRIKEYEGTWRVLDRMTYSVDFGVYESFILLEHEQGKERNIISNSYLEVIRTGVVDGFEDIYF